MMIDSNAECPAQYCFGRWNHQIAVLPDRCCTSRIDRVTARFAHKHIEQLANHLSGHDKQRRRDGADKVFCPLLSAGSSQALGRNQDVCVERG
jgi:hypothetical protein